MSCFTLKITAGTQKFLSVIANVAAPAELVITQFAYQLLQVLLLYQLNK